MKDQDSAVPPETDADSDSDTDVDADADSDADTDCLPHDGVMDLCGADAKLLGGTVCATAGDVNQDGHDDILVGSLTAVDGLVSSFVVHGPVQGEVDMDDAAARLLSEYDWWDSKVGAIAGGSDVNGDGWLDIAVTDDLHDYGSVYVVLGPVTGEMSLADADVKWTGEQAAALGDTVAFAGDIDGDGVGDLLVGSPYYDGKGTNQGCTYLVHGPPGSGDIRDVADVVVGESEYDGAGWPVVGGSDLDGDGIHDIAIGATGEDTAADRAGAAYVVVEVQTGETSLADAAAKMTGEAEGDSAGSSISMGGDADGDGMGDLLISAVGEDTGGNCAGAVYLVLSPVHGTSSLSGARAKLIGEDSWDMAGISASFVADVNADGVEDLLIGAYSESTTAATAGAAYVVLGPLSGTVSLSDADLKLTGEHDNDAAGFTVAYSGDVDADGLPDILIAAPGEDSGNGDAGATYFLRGRTDFYGPWSGDDGEAGR